MNPALIIDPSLHSADGHHLDVLKRFRAELADLQVRSVSLVSRQASVELCRKEGLVATFERGIYFRTRWTHSEFIECADSIRHDMSQAAQNLGLRPSLIVLPAADQTVIGGLAQHLRRFRFHKPRMLLLWLMMAPHYRKPFDDPSVAPLREEYRQAFMSLRGVLRDDSRLRLFCETRAMASAYEQLIELPVATTIVHKSISKPRAARPRAPGDAINIVCAGNANAAKGYSLLAEAVQHLNRKRSDLRFLIHGTVDQTDFPEGRQVMQQLSALAGNVSVRTDVLSSGDYLAWLSQADIVLLPYDPYVYRTRGSGIYAETCKLGIPVVVSNGCAFAADAIEEGRATGFATYTARGLADAVLAAANRLDETTHMAQVHASVSVGDETLKATLAEAANAASRPLSRIERMR